jgi:SnoaL-like domain
MSEPLLSAALQQLIDRQQIHDCLVRYCRGVDRFDRELLLSVYHPDALDDHGVFVGGPEAFADWAFGYHREHQISSHHMVFNHTLDLQGDTAHSEIQWLFFGENRVKPNTLAVGRYLDRFERRHGRWAIAARVCVSEAVNDLAATELPAEYLAALMGNGPSTRDRHDRSYDRPLKARAPR